MPPLVFEVGESLSPASNPGHMRVGQRVRTLRKLDLGSDGLVEKGAVGVLESTSNSPYTPFLVRFPQGAFAFEDGEIEEIDETEDGPPMKTP